MKSFRAPDVNFRCRFVYSTRPPPVGPVTDRLLAAGLGWAWTWTRTYDIGVHSLRPFRCIQSFLRFYSNCLAFWLDLRVH